MRVRPIEDGEFAQLASFRCAQGSSWTRTIERLVQRELVEVFNAPDRVLEVLVAVEFDELLGVAAVEPVEAEPNRWAIRLVAVARDRHRQGIGRALFGAALDLCAARGAKQAIFETHRRNEAMLRLATTFGGVWTIDPEDGEFHLGVILLTER